MQSFHLPGSMPAKIFTCLIIFILLITAISCGSSQDSSDSSQSDVFKDSTGSAPSGQSFSSSRTSRGTEVNSQQRANNVQAQISKNRNRRSFWSRLQFWKRQSVTRTPVPAVRSSRGDVRGSDSVRRTSRTQATVTTKIPSGNIKAPAQTVNNVLPVFASHWVTDPLWNAPAKEVSGQTGFQGVVFMTPDVRSAKNVQVTLQTGVKLPFDKGPALIVPTSPSKISVELRERIDNSGPNERGQIVIHLRDPIKLKQMPRSKSHDRNSSEWLAVQAQRRSYMNDLQIARDKQVKMFVEQTADRADLKVLFVPWLASTPIVDMRFADVEGLAASNDVVTMHLNVGELEFYHNPHQGVDPDTNDDIIDVRNALRTDPYDKPGLRNGFIGVIDTGKRITHNMLDDNPGAWAGDCFYGGNNCWGDGGAPNGAAGTQFPNYNLIDEAFNNTGHGTPILGGIRGSSDLGTELRGITQITTDFWKISDNTIANPNYNGSLSPTMRSIQKAVDSGNDVINNSYGSWGSHNGLDALATLFDNAYDLGLVVIVANGNDACSTRRVWNPVANQWTNWDDGDCTDAPNRQGAITTDHNGSAMTEPAFGSVSSGASAHKAIGVGAHEIDPLCVFWGVNSNVCSYSSRGPTTDGRYKPDILGYTNYESSNAIGDNSTINMGGTSGAAPTIAAMAQMFNNLFEKATNTADWLSPGHVYAALIGSGEHTTKWEGSYTYIGTEPGVATLNIEGAGRPKMPVNGTVTFGGVTLENSGDLATVNVNVPQGACGVKGAIWWPESAGQDHNDIDLIIRNPKNIIVGLAESGNSVWERVSVDGGVKGLLAGQYKVQILGFEVNSQQPVYYSISVSKSQCWG